MARLPNQNGRKIPRNSLPHKARQFGISGIPKKSKMNSKKPKRASVAWKVIQPIEIQPSFPDPIIQTNSPEGSVSGDYGASHPYTLFLTRELKKQSPSDQAEVLTLHELAWEKYKKLSSKVLQILDRNMHNEVLKHRTKWPLASDGFVKANDYDLCTKFNAHYYPEVKPQTCFSIVKILEKIGRDADFDSIATSQFWKAKIRKDKSALWDKIKEFSPPLLWEIRNCLEIKGCSEDVVEKAWNLMIERKVNRTKTNSRLTIIKDGNMFVNMIHEFKNQHAATKMDMERFITGLYQTDARVFNELINGLAKHLPKAWVLFPTSAYKSTSSRDGMNFPWLSIAYLESVHEGTERLLIPIVLQGFGKEDDNDHVIGIDVEVGRNIVNYFDPTGSKDKESDVKVIVENLNEYWKIKGIDKKWCGKSMFTIGEQKLPFLQHTDGCGTAVLLYFYHQIVGSQFKQFEYSEFEWLQLKKEIVQFTLSND